MTIQKSITRYVALLLAAVLLFASVLLLPVVLSSCSVSLASTEEESAVVMTVGDFSVPYELYRYLVLNYKDQYITDESIWEDAAAAAEMNDRITGYVMQSLRDIYAVFSLCADYSISVDDEMIQTVVESSVESMKSQYSSTGKYKSALEENHMNDSVYRLIEGKDACSDELYYAMINQLDEEDVTAVLYSDAFICVKQILVMGGNGSEAEGDTYFTAAENHTNAEALALAEEAREKAARGEDFDALVAAYGESLTMFGNTDGIYLCHGMWDNINEQAAFALEIGEISPVIESEKGFSVFLRCEKNDSYVSSHLDEMKEDYYEALFMLALEERSAQLTIETNALYDSYSISQMQ